MIQTFYLLVMLSANNAYIAHTGLSLEECGLEVSRQTNNTLGATYSCIPEN